MSLTLVSHEDPILKSSVEDFDFNGEVDAVDLAQQLYETMRKFGGVGLSANQVGINTKVFVIGWDEARINVFNPVIVNYTGKDILMDEGCLSFPGVYMKVKRPGSVHVKFQNEYGEWKEEVYSGITARIFLHEYDHMVGKTFKDRVSNMKWERSLQRLTKRIRRMK
jgi:peptide deformylase